ncbi:hypothetical protein FGO68_gene14756 [Halteria grandinella]|uniref:Uncharacterized protein n=1 Tax=Halteria grandinella TaxID=5974 RepID=A0A8J8NZ17_HALGN|nr:hypothetical protein FGO68_gene14756 [Halteria grandinella]
MSSCKRLALWAISMQAERALTLQVQVIQRWVFQLLILSAQYVINRKLLSLSQVFFNKLEGVNALFLIPYIHRLRCLNPTPSEVSDL